MFAVARWKGGFSYSFNSMFAAYSRWVRIIEIVLFFGLLAGFFIYVPFQKVFEAIKETTPSFFWVSILVGLPATYLDSVQLWILVRRQGIHIPVIKLFEINWVIRFYSFFSPVSTVGSVMRWYKLSGEGKSTEALTAVAVNRLFDTFIAIAMGMFWLIGDLEHSLIRPATFIVLLLVILAVWLIATRFLRPMFNWAQPKIHPRSPLLKKIVNFLGKLFNSLAVYSRFSALELLVLVVVGLSGELMNLLAYFLLIQSLQIRIPFTELGWMRSIFFLASLIPLTLVGGLGLREVSVVVLMSAFGIPADLAAAYAFLLYVRSVILSLAGGMIELISLLPAKRLT